MKTNKILSLLLILVLLFSILCIPAWAAPEGQTIEKAPSDTQTLPDETIAPTDDATAADPQSPAQTPPTAGPSHTVQAKAALLIEMNTNQILLEQNADEKLYPASLTKIMTCLLALRHGNLSDQVTVSETALAGLDEAGSTADLAVGETLSLEELLYCMMLSSANEACNVVAEYVSGSVDAFLVLMNEEATALGCTGTNFANTHGLNNEEHYTTARDLSLITQEALKSELFKTITSTATHEVPATNLSGPRQLLTTNFLISRDTTTNYYYEYASGVKTGFTTPAGRCLISTANNGKLSLLSVVLGAGTVILDTGDLELQNFTETKSLFEYGFNNFAYANILNTMPIAQIPVLLSAGAETAVLSPNKEISALLPAGYTADELVTDIKLVSDTGVEAPIAKGQVLGTVTVSYHGQQLGTADLVAITEIAKSEVAAATNNTKSFFAVNWWKLLLVLLVLFVIVYIVIVSINRARRRRYRQRRREMMRKHRGEVIDFPGVRKNDAYDDEEE